jgi:hypothetical protein
MMQSVSWDDVGEGPAPRRARPSRGRAVVPCTCGHRVKEHFEKSEDPERRCSIPGCPCRGLKKLTEAA